MIDHTVVSQEEWLAARMKLLEKEKEFSRLRDELTKSRQSLPWERVEKAYFFEGRLARRVYPVCLMARVN